jgi:ferredoxin
MVYVINTEVCSGCGACTSACPTGAISWQTEPETKPVNAITELPANQPNEIVAVADPIPLSPLRETVLSTLLWTGREMMPRLANLALDYLERRAQAPPSNPNRQNIQGSGQRQSQAGRQRQRRKQWKRNGFRDCNM